MIDKDLMATQRYRKAVEPKEGGQQVDEETMELRIDQATDNGRDDEACGGRITAAIILSVEKQPQEPNKISGV